MLLAAKDAEIERVYALVRDLQKSVPPVILAEAAAARRAPGVQQVTPMDTLAEEAQGQQELDAEGWDGDELDDPPVEGAILLKDMYQEFEQVHGPNAALHLAGMFNQKPPVKANGEA
jgi:hypothetical protein